MKNREMLWDRSPFGRIARVFLFALACALPIPASAAVGDANTSGAAAPERYDTDCKALTAIGRVPPTDYRKATARQREIVERYHFTEHYSAYLAGRSKFQKKIDRIYETPAAGFNYTLWAFPNHPQALAAMEDLGFRGKTEKPTGSELRVHCYFQRAVRVAPDDTMVRALYGYFYARRQMPAEARQDLALADTSTGRDDYNVQSYLAWAYIQLGDLEAAANHAKRAYELGLTLPGLRNRLAKLGRPLD